MVKLTPSLKPDMWSWEYLICQTRSQSNHLLVFNRRSKIIGLKVHVPLKQTAAVETTTGDGQFQYAVKNLHITLHAGDKSKQEKTDVSETRTCEMKLNRNAQ